MNQGLVAAGHKPLKHLTGPKGSSGRAEGLGFQSPVLSEWRNLI